MFGIPTHVWGLCCRPNTHTCFVVSFIMHRNSQDRNKQDNRVQFCIVVFTISLVFIGQQELHFLLVSFCMIRRMKSEVLQDLPSKTRAGLMIKVGHHEEMSDEVSVTKYFWYSYCPHTNALALSYALMPLFVAFFPSLSSLSIFVDMVSSSAGVFNKAFALCYSLACSLICVCVPIAYYHDSYQVPQRHSLYLFMILLLSSLGMIQVQCSVSFSLLCHCSFTICN